MQIFIILLSIGVIKCHLKGNLNVSFWNQVTNRDQVLESWTRLSHQTLNLDLLTSGLASKLDALLDNKANVTSKCAQSLLRLRNDARQMKLWAINGKSGPFLVVCSNSRCKIIFFCLLKKHLNHGADFHRKASLEVR